MITQSHPFRNRQFSKLRVKLNNFTGLSHSELADFSVNNDGFIKPFHKLSLGLIGSPAASGASWMLVEGPGVASGKKIWNKFETNIFLAYLTPRLPIRVHKKMSSLSIQLFGRTQGTCIYECLILYRQTNKQTNRQI